MVTHLENALAILGLRGTASPNVLWQHYTDRLCVLQSDLIHARSDSAQQEAQRELARLVAAYEFVKRAIEPAKPIDRNAVTMMRIETDAVGETHAQGVTQKVIGPGVVLLGRYEIQSVLGDGGMGRVFAARDRLKDEDIAIKVLRSELLGSVAARGRFLAEAKVSCRLAHPNIVRVFDVGVVGGRYFFTMERLTGMSLRRRMQSQQASGQPFPLEEASAIAEQLIEALKHAHKYIVHRDLKPENVWLDSSGAVKLMDFGIARAYVQGELTRTGMNLGTAYYMAPEQHSDPKEVDWRADQYAFGVMMYELLTGTVPMGAVLPIQKLRRDLPRAYARAIMRAMSPIPADRFSSLRELQKSIVSRREEDAPGAVFNALGRAIALGSIAGSVFAYFDSLSLSRVHEWMYPSGIAVGIGTVLMVEFCESFLRSRFRGHIAGAFTMTVLWIGAVLVLAQHLSGLSNGLVVMLCGSVWPTGMDYVTRRWRISAGRYRLQVAFASAVFGTLVGLGLLFEADHGAMRNYWFSALSGLLPGMIITMASLRRRLWRRADSPFARMFRLAPD